MQKLEVEKKEKIRKKKKKVEINLRFAAVQKSGFKN